MNEYAGCQCNQHLADALKLALTPARPLPMGWIVSACVLIGYVSGAAHVGWLLGGIFK